MSHPMHNLRQQITRQRSELDDEFQIIAAAAIADRIAEIRALRRASRIAIYSAFRGEVNCEPVLNMQILRKKSVFLPILKKKHIKFAPLYPDTKWTTNRFGILEPVYSNCDLVSGRELDVVLVPLVGFDRECNRIGMGAGYYDRCFAFRKRRSVWRKPLLIGLAYDFQRIESIRPEVWDVPLDCVVTEEECYGSY
jgi:5-formyltetrahydrofolate cyclo-ligase